jgi:tripartite-type tricarboxylate transporter receptor subunit TctC
MFSPNLRGLGRSVTLWATIAFVISAVMHDPGRAMAQSVEEFYSGRQVKFVVGSAGGGGYELYSRLLARYLSKHLPGHPLFVVQMMPGAGGVVSANYLYNVAPPDGSELGMVGSVVGTLPLISPQDSALRYTATKFNWIGTPQREIGFVLARTSSPVRTFTDLTRHELVVSGTSIGGGPSYFPVLLNKLLGTRFKVVVGYKGSQEALLAMERGEVDGHVSGSSAAPLRARVRPWIREGKVRLIGLIGLTKDSEFSEAPLVVDLTEQPIERQILEVIFSQQTTAWPIVMPPGVPPERVEAMRAAFDASVVDPDFIAEAAKQKLMLNPLSGKEIHKLLDRLYQTPKHILDRVVELSVRSN